MRLERERSRGSVFGSLYLRTFVGRLRLCDFRVITKDGAPYLTRHFLYPRQRESSDQPARTRLRIYLHRIDQSDIDRDLHDHPWSFLTLICSGGYSEEIVHRRKGWPMTEYVERHWGSVAFRPAEFLHRVHLYRPGTWTLVVAGKRRRKWGYQTSHGWVAFDAYHYARGLDDEAIRT